MCPRGALLALYGQAGGARWLEDAACDGGDDAAEGRTRFAPPAGAYTLCESRVSLRAEATSWAAAVAGHAETVVTVRLGMGADPRAPFRWPDGSDPGSGGLPCPW